MEHMRSEPSVAQRSSGSELHATPLEPTDAAVENEHLASVELAVFLGNDLPEFHDLKHGSRTHSRARQSAPVLREQLAEADNPVLDVYVRPLLRAEIPAFPVRVDRAHEVEVRGHRLLLQSDRF
jgi:hypothetical protein